MTGAERVLLVDDDDAFRARLEEAFATRGIEVRSAATISDAQVKAPSFLPTHAVVDLRLAGESGLSLVEGLVRDFRARVVMLTGYGSVATALEAVRLGAVNYLAKPVALEALLEALWGEPLQPVSGTGPKGAGTLPHIEWEHIQRVLRDCNGNITHAARVLGIHRQALQRKLRAPPTSVC